MNTQRDINLTFIQSKGFDTSTLTGLNSALTWMLINSVETVIAELTLS